MKIGDGWCNDFVTADDIRFSITGTAPLAEARRASGGALVDRSYINKKERSW
jgi:hypothetical protein